MKKKLISILTPCYNEEANIRKVAGAVQTLMARHKRYDFEHVFIDNASTDNTVAILRELAQKDRRVKLILNSRNYGHLRSPFYGVLQCRGDAVILLVSDLQDPPELISQFIKEWEAGYKVVIGVKNKSEESPVMFWIRKVYYRLIRLLGESEHVDNFTGFGLYDRLAVEAFKKISDPYPYFRGMVGEIGFPRKTISYTQPQRKSGKSKNNFFTLYDLAILGFVNNSRVPLRLAVFIGLASGGISLLAALFYFTYKLFFWNEFQLGTAPVVIGIFFFSSVQLFFIGIIGEYIGAIHTQVKNRPLVIEKERVNFR